MFIIFERLYLGYDNGQLSHLPMLCLYIHRYTLFFVLVAGLGDIRNDHDANLTYEGENHVLIQPAGNFLLKLWPLVLARKPISSPLQSINFLTNGLDILSAKFMATSVEEMCNPNSKQFIYYVIFWQLFLFLF